MSKELLELRKGMKKKKPDFIMQDAHKKPKLAKKWRNPKGIDSKIRQGLNGYRKKPSQGYRSPKSIRNMDPSGLMPVIINNSRELESIDKEKEGVIVGAKVSIKKKIEILQEAVEKGLSVINIKDVNKFIKEKKDAFESRISTKKKKTEEKDKKQKEKEKKTEDKKEDISEKIDEEEKKEKEKKDKDKVLTKKK